MEKSQLLTQEARHFLASIGAVGPYYKSNATPKKLTQQKLQFEIKLQRSSPQSGE